MKLHQSLRFKLTIAFILLGLGPLVFMGAAAFYLLSVTHTKDLITMETQLLRQKAGEIDKTISQVVDLFDLHVSSTENASIAMADQRYLLQSFLQENPAIVSVGFVELTGQETLKLSRNATADLIPTRIHSLPQFQMARQGKTYFGPVHYTLSGPLATVGAPVTNANNEIIMVLTAEVSLSNIQQIIQGARLGQAGYIYVVDRDGIVLAGPDQDIIGKTRFDDPWIRTLVAGQAHDGQSGMEKRLSFAGVESFSTALPLTKFGWGLVADWPIIDANRILTDIRRQILAVAALTLFCIAGMTVFVGRWILRPLSELGQGAKRIGTGDLGFKIQTRGTGDEIDNLAGIFNQMGDGLKQVQHLKETEIRAAALSETLRKEQEISWAKDEFIRNTSHQLRTPLSIIGWNVDLVAEAGDLKDIPELTKNLRAGFDQLNNMVNDLITSSEFGLGFRNVLVKPFEWSAVVEKINTQYHDAIAAKKVKWETKIDGSIKNFLANPHAMEVLVGMLADNAITYTAEGGSITVDIVPEANGVHISIRDTGIGIPEKDQPLIFTQFFRATNAINMKNVSTGLGLYIAKNIVEGHGGKIWFESKEGAGTTFHAVIPQGTITPEVPKQA